jgi:DNA-binding MarR family transcriptional regulator
MTDSQRILDALRRLVQILRLSDRAAQNATGLSAAQLFVLSELGRSPALSLRELSIRARTDQSSVSVVVARLAEAGLVVRERARDDARRLELTLTSAGRRALLKAPPVAQELLLSTLDRMKPLERKRFATTFTRILTEMGAADGAPPMFFEDERRSPKRSRATSGQRASSLKEKKGLRA